jgi:hypothetical protein
MYEICREVLQDPNRFDSISQAGYRAVQEKLSSRDWFSELLTRIASNQIPRATFERSRLRTGAMEMVKRVHGMDHLLSELLLANA